MWDNKEEIDNIFKAELTNSNIVFDKHSSWNKLEKKHRKRSIKISATIAAAILFGLLIVSALLLMPNKKKENTLSLAEKRKMLHEFEKIIQQPVYKISSYKNSEMILTKIEN